MSHNAHVTDLPLVQALWWFIENKGSCKSDEFFKLRERYRNEVQGPTEYTVFIIDADQPGTTYITSVETDDIDDAKVRAKQMCAKDWGPCHGELYEGNLHVLGVATGDVNILEWEDLWA